MAKRTEKVTETNVESTVEQVTERAVESKDPFKEMVEKNYPLARGEDDFFYAEVNGKGYKVKRGITVEVPKPIAEVIDNKLRMEFIAHSFIQENKKED